MTNKVPVLALLLALSLPLIDSRADEPGSKQQKLEASLRQLEKEISAVRGLVFKEPVKAKIIPRTRDVEASLKGYYNPTEKTLFVYDDLADNYERGVLIHEMVHALQDQHFNLKKLHQAQFDSDADLARAALIEGDATFTMIELLKKNQPAVAKMLDAPLDKAKNLQRAFLYSQGARYVKALKERGGWEAVNGAYRFMPASTASILHPEGITTIDLGPGKTRGELHLISLLVANEATAPLALQAASGWRGDRFRETDQGSTWVLNFVSAAAALRCRNALARLEFANNPELKKLDADATCWKTKSGALVSMTAVGSRVTVIQAKDEAGLHALQERVFGPLDLTVYDTKDKKQISFGEFTDRMMKADLICIGETHDSDLHHRVQLQIIKALFARDERLGVGMEMFQRPYQGVLDRYGRGELIDEEMLALAEYKQRWGYDWSLYRPIVQFCRNNGIPLAALNAPKELTQKISKSGHASLSDEEKAQLGPIDFQVKVHRDYWYERLAAMHGNTKVPEDRKEKSYQVMTVWDEFMADSAARFQMERHLSRMVVLAGSGHIERGFGIPDRATKRTKGKAITVGIEIETPMEKVAADAASDYIVVVR